MSGQLIPPPELAPSPGGAATPLDRVRMWCDLMNACERLHLAGLRQRVGPAGDVELAYRQWHDRQLADRDEETVARLEHFSRFGDRDDF